MAGSTRARVISTAIAPYLYQSGVLGRVHSVFRSALNLTVSDELITLATPSTGALPNGVVLDSETDLRRLPVGALVWSSSQSLSCLDLQVELIDAQLWSPLLEGRGEFRPLHEVRGALARALQRRAPSGGFTDALRRLAEGARDVSAGYPAMSEVLRAVGDSDLARALSSARRLIGLGQGLTPSGDDFLIGLCAALRAAEHPLHAEFASGCWQQAEGRTTTVSEMFYRCAARGEYSGRIHRVVSTLTDRAADPAVELERALDWGASSGADCVLGLLLGGAATRRALVGAK